MANVIAQTGRPALVPAHNKTLAAQLCNELREFFPENAVEHFISYYDCTNRRPTYRSAIPTSPRHVDQRGDRYAAPLGDTPLFERAT